MTCGYYEPLIHPTQNGGPCLSVIPSCDPLILHTNKALTPHSSYVGGTHSTSKPLELVYGHHIRIRKAQSSGSEPSHD